jgi:hypothetical protein
MGICQVAVKKNKSCAFNENWRQVACVTLVDMSEFQCAGCGEWNETQVDSSAGTTQTYVEDCQVCCKPNVLRITWDRTAEEFVIQAELE